jgi:alcohol dehydrogenase class IV
MFAALQRALSDESEECRLNAASALFYLGIKEAVAELALCDRKPDSVFSQVVGHRLRDLTAVADLPRSLRDVPVPEEALPRLAEEASTQWTGRFSRRHFDAAAALEIYQAAF